MLFLKNVNLKRLFEFYTEDADINDILPPGMPMRLKDTFSNFKLFIYSLSLSPFYSLEQINENANHYLNI